MKRHLTFGPLVWLAAAIASLSPAWALQDANQNGLSDVWERHYNGGQLFSASNPAHAPGADPDSDGWTNLKEAIAGTHPFNALPPQGFVPAEIVRHLEIDGLFMISWPSISGKTYKLAMSEDLEQWADFGEAIPGTGGTIALAVDAMFEDGTLPDALFWRVKIEDEDPDNDGLTSWEELALGLDPNHPDTDRDGIPDGIDPAPGKLGTPYSETSATYADPDGLGLPASLNTGLIGRWDFESTIPLANRLTGFFFDGYRDSTPNSRHAWRTLDTEVHPLGMPSKGTDHTGGFAAFPRSLLDGRIRYSVSFWVRLKEGSLASNPNDGVVGLFNHHRYQPYRNPNTGKLDWSRRYIEVQGVNFTKEPDGTMMLRAGLYTWQNYDFATGSLTGISTTTKGVAIAAPPLAFDDGQWHHYVFVKNDAVLTLYIDGVSRGSASENVPTLSANDYNGVSLGRTYGVSPELESTQPPDVTRVRGTFDRLRVWSRALPQADVTALFQQDIDQDRLWDINEVKSRLWRDANSDSELQSGEVSFGISPFEWQLPDTDSDEDGLTDIEEQNVHKTSVHNPDTDGDLMPDGWEVAHGLNPRVKDGHLDKDGDGLNNLNEYRFASNPNLTDSDGDGRSDYQEVAQGGHPGDGRDGGNPPNSQDNFSVFLAVGDQSGSHSEDYVLHCYRLDPASGAEDRFYTLRSGGHGQYQQENKNNFRRGDSYSFQIQWLSSTQKPAPSGSPSEGPDFDYTLRVEPQGNHGAVVVDSVDRSTQEKGSSIRGVADDVADFRGTVQRRRVMLYSGRIVADTNRDGQITDADLKDKDTWTKEKGAIYSVNFDRDGSNRTSSGRPAADAITWWDVPGDPEHEDWRIDGTSDVEDITPFEITIPDLPQGSKCFLTVGSEEQMKAAHFFSKRRGGQPAFWGGITTKGRPWTDGDEVLTDIEITGALNPQPSANARPKAGKYEFGLEGLAFRGMKVPGGTLAGGGFGGFIELGLKVEIPGEQNRIDWGKIKLKVAPFLLTPNDKPTDKVFVRDLVQENQAVGLQAMPKAVPISQGAPSQWMQDHAEIGYTQRPGGPVTKMTLVCPYDGELAQWPRQHLAEKNKGFFALSNNFGGGGGDYGGNIELLPSSGNYPLGRIVAGNTMSGPLRAFLEAQEVQPLVVLPIAYTEVQHIDEVFSPGPGGVTYVPGPAEAIALLQSQFNTEEKQVRGVFFTPDTQMPSVGKVWKSAASTATPYIITDLEYDAVIQEWSRFSQGGYARLVGGTSGGQVARIKSVSRATQADGNRIGFAGNPEGKLMLQFDLYCDTGALPSRDWKLNVPQKADAWFRKPLEGAYVVCVKETLQWRYGGALNPAIMTVKEVLADPDFVGLNQTMLPSNIAGTVNAGGVGNVVRLPCLFYLRAPTDGDPHAVAYTPNAVNLQWVNSAAVNPKVFGPQIGLGGDVLAAGIQAVLPGTSSFIDDWRLFHIQEGEVHCGSAAERNAESGWWSK